MLAVYTVTGRAMMEVPVGSLDPNTFPERGRKLCPPHNLVQSPVTLEDITGCGLTFSQFLNPAQGPPLCPYPLTFSDIRMDEGIDLDKSSELSEA